jgi:hypothetical protein
MVPQQSFIFILAQWFSVIFLSLKDDLRLSFEYGRLLAQHSF